MSHEQCRYLLGSLSEYIDGKLDESICQEIEQHMAGCENCRVVIDTLRKTVSLYHEEALHTQTPEDVRQRLYKRLKLEDFLLSKKP
ncbi:MAG: zf-HC2 domain-containing protein [Anaerolineales bacterium]|nr:zf-HC2 domain-containing protein [Anaerolineales bacterium]